MGYVKDIQISRVMGDFLLQWLGEGDRVEFGHFAASQVWVGL